MKNIEIERYETPKVDIYRSTGEFYGTFNNEHECNKFRVKMLLNDATQDFYFMWGDVRINIQESGDMDKFPLGLYDQVMHDMSSLFTIRKEKEKDFLQTVKNFNL